jgi:hypothetical protein
MPPEAWYEMYVKPWHDISVDSRDRGLRRAGGDHLPSAVEIVYLRLLLRGMGFLPEGCTPVFESTSQSSPGCTPDMEDSNAEVAVEAARQ